MRYLMIPLALCLCAQNFSVEKAVDSTSMKAVNTKCPVSGEAVDTSITPVEAKTKDGKMVMVGMCCSKCSATISKSPETYGEAANSNTRYTCDGSKDGMDMGTDATDKSHAKTKTATKAKGCCE